MLFIVVISLLLTGCASVGFQMDRTRDLNTFIPVEIDLDTLHVFTERTEIQVTYDQDQTWMGYLDEVVPGQYIVLRKHWGVAGDEVISIPWHRIVKVERLEYPGGKPSNSGFIWGAIIDTTIGWMVLGFLSIQLLILIYPKIYE